MGLKPSHHFRGDRLTGRDGRCTFHRVMGVVVNHPDTVLLSQYLVTAIDALVIFQRCRTGSQVYTQLVSNRRCCYGIFHIVFARQVQTERLVIQLETDFHAHLFEIAGGITCIMTCIRGKIIGPLRRERGRQWMRLVGDKFAGIVFKGTEQAEQFLNLLVILINIHQQPDLGLILNN